MRRKTSVPGLLAALAALLVVGCRSVSPPGAYFDTDPRGAEVFVDGRASGSVTPCLIALEEDDYVRVRLVLPGYEPREILLVPNDRTHRIPWTDGTYAPNGAALFAGLGAEDLFTPVRNNEGHAPGRVFVRLEPISEAETSGT